MIGILIAILLAALVYLLCGALGLPHVVALIAAILVLLLAVAEHGPGPYGGGRWRRW